MSHEDKKGFSGLIHSVHDKQIDIMIHSPGGSAEAVEMIARMLRAKYEHIRFIVPDAAKSAATMLALSGNLILMGHRSELGPIDPQVRILMNEQQQAAYVPAETITKGFERAKAEIIDNPAALPAFIPMLNKYDLYLFEICENATALAKRLVTEWLENYMFHGLPDSHTLSLDIANKFAKHSELLSHGRPITLATCQSWKLNVQEIPADVEEKIWQLHCAYLFHFDSTPTVVKIFENARGTSWHSQFVPVQMIQRT